MSKLYGPNDPNQLNQSFRDILHPIVEHIQFEFSILRGNLVIMLNTKTDQELKQILKAAKKAHCWNCGWVTYMLAPVIREIVRDVINSRRNNDV